MNRDDIFTEKAKNDDEMKTVIKRRSSVRFQQMATFRKACENAHASVPAIPDSEIQNRQKTKRRASKLQLKFPIKIFVSIIQSK